MFSRPHISPVTGPDAGEQGFQPERQSFLMPATLDNMNTVTKSTSISSMKSNVAVRREAITRWAQSRPISGILALCITVGTAFFSLAIVAASDNQPVDNWTVQPTVYLAIAATVGNSALAFAYAQAAPISWWYQASRGATIRALERQWESSFSLHKAIFHCRDSSIIIAASVLVPLMMFDGPLLQRAASVQVARQSELITLNFSLAPEVPRGFSGSSRFKELTPSDVSLAVSQDWMKQNAISLPVHPACDGTCVGKAIAPGVVKTNCTTRTWPITYDIWHNPNATWGTQHPMDQDFDHGSIRNPNPLSVTSMRVHISAEGHADIASEAVWLFTGFIDVVNGSSTYTETQCYWVPAILEHDVQFDDASNIKVLTDPQSTGRLISLANNTVAPSSNMTILPATMTILTSYLNAFVFTNVSAIYPKGYYNWEDDSTTFNAQSMKYASWSSQYDPVTALAYADPTLDITNSLENMLFRAAIVSSTWSNLTSLIDPGLSPSQSTTATQTVTRNVFHSDFKWYAAATALEVLVALVVLPMFWGWWTLDTHLDLSPLRLGLAFQAPLLAGAEPSKGAAGVVKDLGAMHVKFVSSVLQETAPPAKVDIPDTERNGSEMSQYRLWGGVVEAYERI